MRAEPGLTARSAPGNGSAAGDDAGVDQAEGGGGERGEHARVRSQRFGHSLATGQPGPDELVGVGPVGLRTRRAHGRAAVAARDVDRLVRQVLGVQAVEDLAGDGVDVTDGATQPNRPNAASGSQGSGQPAVIVVPGGALEQLDAEAPAVPASSRPVITRTEARASAEEVMLERPLAVSSASAGMFRLLPRGGRIGCGYTAVRQGTGYIRPWTRCRARQRRPRWRRRLVGVRYSAQAENRRRETLGRTDRRQLPRATRTALVVAA